MSNNHADLGDLSSTDSDEDFMQDATAAGPDELDTFDTTLEDLLNNPSTNHNGFDQDFWNTPHPHNQNTGDLKQRVTFDATASRPKIIPRPDDDFINSAPFEAVPSSPSQSEKRRESDVIEETASETVLRLSNEFAPIVEKDADTLLYIGPPPQATGQDDHDYEYIKQHFYRPYLMRSDTLKAVNSAKFNKFLGPMSARTERKLKKLGIHKRIMSSEKIKYYIDLRPMVDDDEALIMLTELSSPTGVLMWHQTAHIYHVPPELTCGRDDLNVPPKPTYKSTLTIDFDDEPPAPVVVRDFQPITVIPGGYRTTTNDAAAEKAKKNMKAESSATRLRGMRNRGPEADYSPLRHHSALERLLHAIAGNDPKLDSAPKAWTFFSIANYFGCATNPKINHWVASWLLRENNDNFIQANPEVVYRMALGMQMPDMMRCAFAMLVGEKALMEVHNPAIAHQSKKSIHNRPLGLLDDDEINRVDHATPSLVRRLKGFFAHVTDPSLPWASLSSQLSKLHAVEIADASEEQIVNDAISCLQNFVRRTILQSLWSPPTARPEITTEAFFQNRDIYSDLPLTSRIFTNTFWTHLASRSIQIDVDTDMSKQLWYDMMSDFKNCLIIGETDPLRPVTRTELFDAFERVNQMIYKGDALPPEFTRTMDAFVQANIDEYGRPIKPRLPPMDIDEVSETPSGSADPWAANQHAHRQHQQEMTEQQKSLQERVQQNRARAAQMVEGQEKVQALREKVAQLQREPRATKSSLPDPPQPNVKYTPEDAEWWDLAERIDLHDKNPDENDPWWWTPSATLVPSSGVPNITEPHETTEGKQFEIHSPEKALPIRKRSQQMSDEDSTDPENSTAISVNELDFDGMNIETTGASTLIDVHDKPLAFRQRDGAKANLEILDETAAQPASKKRVSWDSNTNLPFPISLGSPQKPDRDVKSLLPVTSDTTAKGTFSPAVPKTDVQTNYINPNTGFAKFLAPAKIQESPNKSIWSSTHVTPYDPQWLREWHSKPRAERTPAGLISLSMLLTEITVELREYIDAHITTPGYVADKSCDIGIPSSTLDVLQCLTEDEWKYLPLFAGGLDDGSGGVFANDDLGVGVGGTVPDALDVGEGGFRGGPTAGLLSSGAPTEVMTTTDLDERDGEGDGFSIVHRGVGVGESAGASVCGDGFEDIKTDEGVSTVGKASRIATDGTRDSERDGASTVMSLDE